MPKSRPRVDDEPIDLRKRALVEQELEALVRRLLPGLVLAGNPLDASRQQGGLVAPAEVFEAISEGHVPGVLLAGPDRWLDDGRV